MKFTLSLSLLGLAALTSLSQAATDWNRFRGPNGAGIADTKGLPTKIDESTTLWKVPLDKGWSSPVLWQDKVFVTAETAPAKRAVIALDAKTGKELWRHEETFTEHKKHNFNSFASSSPFVDAERIYINWSTGTTIQALALDHQGKQVWKNEHVADYIHEHGTGVSAYVVDGVMIVRSEFDTEKGGKPLTDDPAQQKWKSGIVGLDAKTGKQLWKLDIPNCLNTYSTPILNERKDGTREVICADTGSGVLGINHKTGKINWQYNPGFNQRSLSSGVLHDGIYFCTFGSGGGAKEVAAIDVSGSEPKPVNFEFSKGLPYVPTPLVIGDIMYLLGDGGIMKAVEFKTGKEIYNERVNGSGGSSKFFSSPVAGDGKIFCGSQQGDFIVLKQGPQFEQIAATKLDSPINATFAIGDGRIYVRTEKMLWCAGDKNAPLP
jgi:outer membrane protein assembly factor BamB